MSFQITNNIGNGANVEWLIPDMVLQNEFVLIDGRGETGKSSIVSSIIGGWANQEDLPIERAFKRVLWLSQEEEFDSIIKPRLMQYGLDSSDVMTIDYASGLQKRPLMPANFAPLADLLKAHFINCIVIDPFTEMKESEWSINDSDAMRAYVSSLSRLCKQTRTTMFGMRHMRKASGVYSSDDGMGSSAIKDTARCVLRADRTEGKKRRHFWSVQKCNAAKPTRPMEFMFEPTPHCFGKVKQLGFQDITIEEIKKMSESQVQRSKLEDAKRLLNEALKDGEISAKQLIQEAKDYGIGDRTLDQAKADLSVSSHRKIDPGTGNAYWVWTLPKEPNKESSSSQGEDMPQLTLDDLARVEPEPEPEPEPKPAQGKKKYVHCKCTISWTREPYVCQNIPGKSGYCSGCKDMLAHFKKVDKEKALGEKKPKKARTKAASA